MDRLLPERRPQTNVVGFLQMSLHLAIWAVYKHPPDYPTQWVAREWVIRRGVIEATDNLIVASQLATIRDHMHALRLTYVQRYQSDDPTIFECWI